MNFRPIPLLASLLASAFVAHPAFSVTVTSSTHPSLLTYDFSDGKIPFAAYQREGGVASGARFKIEDGALVITNEFAGSFGVNPKIPAFDAEKYSHLVFDYALQPDVKVNLFFKLHDNGQFHGATFSGPKGVRPGSVFLGQIKNVVADGKWHRADVPLREWLRKLYPGKTQLMIDEVTIGNWDNTNYLMALGVGGNGRGAEWKVDNFSLVGVGPTEAKFEIKKDDGQPLATAQEYSWSLDGGATTALTNGAVATSPASGFHLLHVFDKAKKTVGGYGFFVTQTPPRIGKPELRENTLRVPIESEAGLDWNALKLTVGDRAFQVDSPYLVPDGANEVLSLQAAEAGFQWNDGQQVPVVLEGVRDVLGRVVDTAKTSVTMDYAKHEAHPSLPQLVKLQEMGEGTFEESLDEWSPKTENEGPAIISRDNSTAATGKYSVRLTASANAGAFGALIRRSPLDVAKYPVIEFDYRIPPDLRTDFYFQWGDQTMSVAFTDRTPQYSRVGAISNVIADDQWHHAQIRLFEMLRAARPAASDFRIDWLAIADTGWLGNAKGIRFWIDNFQFTPVVAGAAFESKVQAPDVTGVKAVSWNLDESVTTDPPQTGTTGDIVKISGAGNKWLHLRAQNGAGEWSVTRHLPLILDTSPPQVGAATPANGASAATSLAIPLHDDTSIDFSSIALTVQGREYSLRDTALRYEPERLAFSLDTALQKGQMQPLDDKARVAWQLKPVRDVAGQSTAQVSGEWTHDFAQDKSGPAVQLLSTTHAASLRATFDENTENWVGENLKLENVRRDIDVNDKTLRATTLAQAASVLRLNHSWDVSRFPMLGFAYKVPAGMNLSLRLRNANKVSILRFIGDVPGAIGDITGGTADGQWHWASVNLGALAQKLGGSQLTMIEIVETSGKVAANTSFEIDNFVIAAAPTGNVKLSWKAYDISGVQNYRFAWDQKPDTAPTEMTADTGRETPSGQGTWWVHVQAQDRAGNWGAVSHLPIPMP